MRNTLTSPKTPVLLIRFPKRNKRKMALRHCFLINRTSRISVCRSRVSGFVREGDIPPPRVTPPRGGGLLGEIIQAPFRQPFSAVIGHLGAGCWLPGATQRTCSPQTNRDYRLSGVRFVSCNPLEVLDSDVSQNSIFLREKKRFFSVLYSRRRLFEPH